MSIFAIILIVIAVGFLRKPIGWLFVFFVQNFIKGAMLFFVFFIIFIILWG